VTELSPLNVFQRCIDCVDIAGRSSAMERQTRVMWGNKLFSSYMCQYFENDKRYVQR